MKTCTRCQLTKNTVEFYKNKRSRDGLDEYCKQCRKEYMSQWHNQKADFWQQYYQQNQAGTEEYRTRKRAERERRLSDPAWVKQETERGVARRRKKGIRERINVPLETQKSKHRQRKRVRKMRMRNVVGAHTQQEWETLCAQFEFRCACCAEVKPLTRDHVVPITRGGSDFISNIQPLCRECNSHKATSMADYR